MFTSLKKDIQQFVVYRLINRWSLNLPILCAVCTMHIFHYRRKKSKHILAPSLFPFPQVKDFLFEIFRNCFSFYLIMNVISRRVRCLVSEVLTECDLEDVVRHNLYRVEEGLIRKPYIFNHNFLLNRQNKKIFCFAHAQYQKVEYFQNWRSST